MPGTRTHGDAKQNKVLVITSVLIPVISRTARAQGIVDRRNAKYGKEFLRKDDDRSQEHEAKASTSAAAGSREDGDDQGTARHATREARPVDLTTSDETRQGQAI